MFTIVLLGLVIAVGYALAAMFATRLFYLVLHDPDSYRRPRGGYGLAGLCWPITLPMTIWVLTLGGVAYAIEWVCTRDR